MAVLLPASLAYKIFVVHIGVVAFIMSISTLGYKYCITWHKNVIEYVYVGNRRGKLKHALKPAQTMRHVTCDCHSGV